MVRRITRVILGALDRAVNRGQRGSYDHYSGYSRPAVVPPAVKKLDSWRAWLVLLRAIFALEMDEADGPHKFLINGAGDRT